MFRNLTLSVACLFSCLVSLQARADIWVNELNYESFPNVEIVVSPTSAGVNLSTVLWSLYDGTTGTVYATHALSTFSVGATVNSYTLYTLSGFTIQNGGPSGGPDIPDGWAISVNGVIQEFKSYEGSFTATSGVAQGLTSMDIGVRQETGTPTASSMQLLDTGTVAANFRWIPGQGPSYGQVNLGQVLAVPEPGSIALLCACVCGVVVHQRLRRRK